MMEFTHEASGTTFSIHEKISVQQYLTHQAILGAADPQNLLMGHWDAAQGLIATWDSPVIPDHKKINFGDDLDPETAVAMGEIITWAGIKVTNYVTSLRKTPKN